MVSMSAPALSILQEFRAYLAYMAAAPLDDLSAKEIAARPVAERLLLPELEVNLLRIITTLSHKRRDAKARDYLWHLIRSLESLGLKYGGQTHLDDPPSLDAELPKPSDLRNGLRYHIAKWAYMAVEDLSSALLESIPPEERVREGIKVLDARLPEWPKLLGRDRCEFALDVAIQIVEPLGGSYDDRDALLDNWFGLVGMGHLERSLWLRIHGLLTPIRPGEGATAEKRAVCMLWWQEAELRLCAAALRRG